MDRYIQIGDVVIGKNHSYVFEDISGIGGGSVRRTENEYINSDGAEFKNIYFTPRNFEIKGYILGKSAENLDELKQRLILACYPKTERTVIYFDGIRKYKAKAYADSLPEFGKRTFSAYWNVPFILNMVIPSFYWTDFSVTNIPIISRQDEFTTSFTLPCIFTSRTAEATIHNDSGFDFYPIIKISAGNQAESGTIKILNSTTGEYIQLSNFTLTPGDIIVIDCENYTATLNGNTNIINSLNDFEDFKIVPGINIINGLNNNSSSAINAAMEYYKKWIGV